MLHRLCGPPSIPLSFSLATVLPRRNAYRVSSGTAGLGTRHTKHSSFKARTTRVSNPVCSPSFRALSVSSGPVRRLRRRCSSRYLRISPLHREFHAPLPPSSTAVSPAGPGLSPGVSQKTYRTAYAPFSPIIPNNACPPRITAAAGTELAGASSTGTVIIVPVERSLRPKGLHPPRGVAASGFPPLCKIPHCCLP